jgi:hypothetical protein
MMVRDQRQMSAVRGHDGLHKYPRNARYRAVDAIMAETLAT